MVTSIYGGKHCNRLAQFCLQSHDEDSLGDLLYLFLFVFIIFFWPCLAACGILVLQLGTEPTPLALGVLTTEPPGSPGYSFY